VQPLLEQIVAVGNEPRCFVFAQRKPFKLPENRLIRCFPQPDPATRQLPVTRLRWLDPLPEQHFPLPRQQQSDAGPRRLMAE